MKEQKILPIIKNTKIWLTFSLILIVISLGAWMIRGLNFGIDFVGGTIVTINVHTTFDVKDVRTITDKYDKNADITYAGDSKQEVVISTKESLNTTQRAELFGAFKTKYNLKDTDLISVDTVTASIGQETTRNTIIASIIAVVLMLVYITFRFEFFFGLSAVIALIHDILVVIGVYALFQIQVNSPFIAAILTILGYSINDTIVVFDRIRENEETIGLKNLPLLVDTSITQTMRRSINTVATTLVAIIALYIFAVTAIRDFALPLIVGITCGCYSSIFVASPLWVIFQKKSSKSRYNTKLKKHEKKRRDRKKSQRDQAPQV